LKAKEFLKLLNKEADRAFLHLPFDLMTQDSLRGERQKVCRAIE